MADDNDDDNADVFVHAEVEGSKNDSKKLTTMLNRLDWNHYTCRYL